MTTKPQFLVVANDEDAARRTAVHYHTFGHVEVVLGLARAANAMNETRSTGVVFERGLSNGDALEFLRRVRALDPIRRAILRMPAIGPVGVMGATASSLGCTFAGHAHFARHAIAAEFLCIEATRLIATLAVQHALTATETRLLALQAAHIPRLEWSPLLGGATASTLKTHARRLCAKAGVRALSDLTDPIARIVLQPAQPRPESRGPLAGDGALHDVPP